jgi:hypothetical protein
MIKIISIIPSLFIFFCAYTYYQPDVLSKSILSNDKLEISRSKPINSGESIFKKETYDKIINDLKSSKYIYEITGIPDSTDTISRIAEISLLAIQRGVARDWIFIKSKNNINRVYFYGCSIFKGSNKDYKKILKSIGLKDKSITINIHKISLINEFINPYYWSWKTHMPLYSVVIENHYKKDDYCGEEIRKYRLYIDYKYEVIAFNTIHEYNDCCPSIRIIPNGN